MTFSQEPPFHAFGCFEVFNTVVNVTFHGLLVKTVKSALGLSPIHIDLPYTLRGVSANVDFSP